jgi:hypothetical protein
MWLQRAAAGDAVLIRDFNAPALELIVSGARPGGQLSHFCVPLYALSASHLSTVTGAARRSVAVRQQQRAMSMLRVG